IVNNIIKYLNTEATSIMTTRCTRRELAIQLAVWSGLGLAPAAVHGRGADDISRNAEAIHQEVNVKATPKRVYAALTDAAEFTSMTTFSRVKDAKPAAIGKAVGEGFSLFSGHVVGRHLELVPNQRIVQAWRATSWQPGIYSIAKFELSDRGGQTTI